MHRDAIIICMLIDAIIMNQKLEGGEAITEGEISLFLPPLFFYNICIHMTFSPPMKKNN